MSASWTDEAILLRTYNVGEMDRFCILLTKCHGRIAARANGARRLLNRKSSGLLPLHRVSVVCEMHSFGAVIASSVCLDPHALSWSDPERFACSEQGIELLLRLTEDGLPMPSVYQLTCDFVSACALPHARILPSLFAIQLLQILGSCPSFTHSSSSHRPFRAGERIVFSSNSSGLVSIDEDPAGQRLSPALLELLVSLTGQSLQETMPCSDTLLSELLIFTQCVLGSQLGSSLKAPDVRLAMSSFVTPI